MSLRLRVTSALKDVASRGIVALRSSTPKARLAEALRYSVLARISDRVQTSEFSTPKGIQRVLLDGMWDNANYWLRMGLVREALGLHHVEEVALLGRYARKRSTGAFKALGVSKTADYESAAKVRNAHLSDAKELLDRVTCAEDILELDLPHGFPADHLYDDILKKQRRSSVDVNDPKLLKYLAEALASIEAASAILDDTDPDLLIMSHSVGYTWGALAWLALQRQKSVLILYGQFGQAQFFHMTLPEHIYAYPSRPSLDELAQISPAKGARLATIGRSALQDRFYGVTDDIGSVYAYQKRSSSVTREGLAKHFGWDAEAPIIGVYNSNWFDFPHASGLKEFRDFLDWITCTIEEAQASDNVNWLFKAHPCDEWYGKINGQTLNDIVVSVGASNIRMADTSWNGLALLEVLDGIVTCHGTVGLEATMLKKPVLVPYEGWYGHARFVQSCQTRQDYKNQLRSTWWENWTEENAETAAQFFGWIHAVPEWQRGFLLEDDSKQDDLLPQLETMLKESGQALDHETKAIREWYESGHPYFNIFKKQQADDFIHPSDAKDSSGS